MKSSTDPASLVSVAAARLELGEFELFRLAHRWWFGAEAQSQILERIFAAYMFRQESPHWARHYAREVLGTRRLDARQARRLGLGRLPESLAARPPGRHVAAAAGILAVGFFALALGVASEPQGGLVQRLSCQGGGPGLVLLEELAYAAAGRRPPAC
jgi:hypothetical protein